MKMVKTRHSGIYRRENGSYAVTFPDQLGAQRWATAYSLEEAVRLKAQHTRRPNHARRVPARAWLLEWVGTHDVEERQVKDYTRYLTVLLGELGPRTTLQQITPQVVVKAAVQVRKKRRLADSTLDKYLSALSRGMDAAVREGLIERNPVRQARVPRQRVIAPAEPRPKAMSREQLRDFMKAAPAYWREIFYVIAASGLRFSEVAGLDVADFLPAAPGRSAQLRVRQAWTGTKLKPAKSDRSHRTVPIDAVAAEICARRAKGRPKKRPLLVTERGTRLAYHSALRNFFKPAARAAGCEWAAFHTLRHTYASLQYDEQAQSALAISRLLGHSKTSFTLDTYISLLEADALQALDLSAVIGADPAAPAA